MGTGDEEDNDPLSVVRRMQQGQSAGQAISKRRTQSSFPAANQVANPRNTAFARNAPINTIAQNLAAMNQIPIGGFGLGALSGVGYSRAPQFNLDSFTNQGGGQQQPTLSAYHWRAGSGGVQGGNDAAADVTWSNGTTGRMLGGVNDFQLGMNQPVAPPDQSQAPTQYPATSSGNTNFNVPGGSMADALSKTVPNGVDYNASTGQYLPASTPGYMSATKGPSQFASMPVTTNQFGQNMINSPNGGQMTTDKRRPSWFSGGY